MKYFYKIEDGQLKRGSGYKIPTGYIEYTKGSEPQEFLDMLEKENAQAQLEATQKEFDNALLLHLDTQCATLGFNGDSSTRPYRAIANYVGYDNVFRIDAEKLGVWIADTFAMAEQIEADIMSGARPLLTVDEFLAELPKYI